MIATTLKIRHKLGARNLKLELERLSQRHLLLSLTCLPPCPAGMTFTPSSDPLSIFKDGKLKPGVYKIQNIASETYLDVDISSRGLCCRPAKDLDEGRGLVRWYVCYPRSAYLTIASGKSKSSGLDIRCRG